MNGLARNLGWVAGLLLISLTAGCSANMQTGVTDYRQYEPGSLSQRSKFFATPDNCIGANSTIDIRLQRVEYGKVFEGIFSASSESMNELGVFVTLEERPIAGNFTGSLANIRRLDRRLVYASNPRKKSVPANQVNTEVYKGPYSGGDLYFKVEVLEFDEKEARKISETLGVLAQANVIASRLSGLGGAGELLNSIGKALLAGFGKDDLITSYEMEFLPCGSVADTPDQIYLSGGDVVLLRLDQKDNPAMDWNGYALTSDKRLAQQASGEAEAPRYSYLVFSIMERRIPPSVAH